jgi:hypothetical protein
VTAPTDWRVPATAAKLTKDAHPVSERLPKRDNEASEPDGRSRLFAALETAVMSRPLQAAWATRADRARPQKP